MPNMLDLRSSNIPIAGKEFVGIILINLVFAILYSYT